MDNELLKDQNWMKHRNKSDYAAGFKALFSAITSEQLLHNLPKKREPHKPKHLGCPGFSEEKGNREVEKQICRCMFYYGKNSSVCMKCGLQQKWHLTDECYEIIECEYPTPFVIDHVGGIDLLVRDKENSKLYAVEVKPRKNTESLVRMMAETLTYQASVKAATNQWNNLTAWHTADATPAIAFFEGSAQDKDWHDPEIRSNTDCQSILRATSLTVFRILVHETKNDIHDFIFQNVTHEV